MRGDKLKKELLSKRESELEDLENSEAIFIGIIDKACSGETPRVWLDNHL